MRPGRGRATPEGPAIDDLKVVLKENIEVGRIVRFEAGDGNVLDTYLHKQDGRGTRACHRARRSAPGARPRDRRPHRLHQAAVPVARRGPAEAAAEERDDPRREITRTEGKPEAALEKIVEGKLNGWYKERVLLEQKYVNDEKQTVTQLLGDAERRPRSATSWSAAEDPMTGTGAGRGSC